MAVEVTKEVRDDAPHLYDLAIEECVKCESSTRYWWADGCMPLCPKCAETVSGRWCYEFARKEGYGPLPDKSSI